MKRKLPIRVLSLVIAAMVLTGALAVSAINGSPYETLKSAVIDLMFFENYTLDAEMVVRVNGEVVEYESSHESYGDRSSLSKSNFSGSRESMRFSTEDIWVRRTWSDGTPSYQVFLNQRSSFGGNRFGGGMFGFGHSPIGRNSNEVRLIELGVDLLVGDLRNHLSMSTQSDGTRRVSGSITGNQLPEIIRLIIDMAIEDEYSWRAERFELMPHHTVLDIPMRSLTINRIYVVGEIDADENISYLRLGINATIENMFDETHTFEAEMAVRFSDIGTSNPVSPIPNLEEIFTREFFYDVTGTSTGAASLRFTLDSDGNIDMDSIH